jgi:hypothetical protein
LERNPFALDRFRGNPTFPTALKGDHNLPYLMKELGLKDTRTEPVLRKRLLVVFTALS